MAALDTTKLLEQLKRGTIDPTLQSQLEAVKFDELLAELVPLFGIKFQERQIGKKREVSLACKLIGKLRSQSAPKSQILHFKVIPVYRDVLMLSAEGDVVTGISRISHLVVKPIRKPEAGLELTTGRGTKLDYTPDGWRVKTLEKKTVKLEEPFLHKRGWRFDFAEQLLAATH